MSKRHFLEFEQPVAELESKIEELRYVQSESAVDISEEIDRLSKKSLQLTKDIYANLTPWQVTQIARHPQRPYTLDYVAEIFTDFQELHGDRHYADDLSIVGGLARFNGQPCMVLGHQKGRDTKERAARNFGMSRPEGYRKALRLMKLAEKFGLPVFTFVDTPGAYPGIGAEERGQSEAIGRNIFEMAQLEVPIICTIIGEGGSGGALAISVGDQTLMLQYSIYSVISPEGCASILWKTAERASDAAEALGVTAHRLKALQLVDKIVNEPSSVARIATRSRWPRSSSARSTMRCASQRPEAQGTAAAPLRAVAGLRPLHRQQGALSALLAAAVKPARRIAVAWSGGRDSTALLHATLVVSAPLGVEVVALHVHHGLSAHADDWVAFCEAQIARWQKRFAVTLRVARPPLDPRQASASKRGRGSNATGRSRRWRGRRGRGRAAGAPPARPVPKPSSSRPCAAAGWRVSRPCRERSSAMASAGRDPGSIASRRASPPMFAATGCAISRTTAMPMHASPAIACACRFGRRSSRRSPRRRPHWQLPPPGRSRPRPASASWRHWT
ncbi:acetyl-CoA carboxylase carboxyltransferase subunit alpha [Piscinibacter aquaticus]|uniref:Acetyl-coenzyme A carboxylase carboxyl transferase subunit alpha n=1 Tax=Piscinibacter aquaticus TaxID=392597 RepID=A0A5C6U318_9BURK|nr:acetyl-CoA carboxylase carboxyltransferase subunit alpha [Piscinibacter aquaticus]